MIHITIPKQELFDETKQEFVYTKEVTLCLEHSLVSISKWESKWNVPFLSEEQKTPEMNLDYIKCMTLTQNVDDSVYNFIDNNIIAKVNEYIGSPMTATTFGSDSNGKKSRRIITSELIYYWMIAQNIPFECQKWHLNRLLTLIRVCGEESGGSSNKMSKQEIMNRNRALNASRRKKYNTKG